MMHSDGEDADDYEEDFEHVEEEEEEDHKEDEQSYDVPSQVKVIN